MQNEPDEPPSVPEPPELAVTYADGDKEDWPVQPCLLASARAMAQRRLQGEELQLQRPSFLFTGLRAKPFWSPEDFPKVVHLLEASAPRLSEEVCQLLGDSGWSTDTEDDSPQRRTSASKRRRLEDTTERGETRPPNWQPQREGLHSGVWLKLEIWAKGGLSELSSSKAVPQTVAAVCAAMRTGEAMTPPPGRAALSLLTLGATIMPHCGPTNHRLRLHLPLLLPRGAQRMSGLSVAGVARDWELHRCLIFDDSFEHQIQMPCAQEDSQEASLAQEARVVLIVDLWHPDADENLRTEKPNAATV